MRSTRPELRPGTVLSAALALVLWGPWVGVGATVFQVTNFADPPWSITYYDGFSGTVGVTSVWPAEMGWEGDQIDIAFDLPTGVPPDARHYRFRIIVTQHFTQSFDLTVWAGPSLGELTQFHAEYMDSARAYAATIPLSGLTPGQTNYIRIKGLGVQVGPGQPSGIQWNKWILTRTDAPGDIETLRTDQLQRLTTYVLDALCPSGLVRDSLILNPADPPFHPASPDAGGFALLAICVADQLGLMYDADVAAEWILSAYGGHTPGVVPDRNVKGFWYHWLDVNTGGHAPGWDDGYTTIGSALLVGGALFAKNHFAGQANIAALADELYATTDFDAAIHPALDGRVYLAMDAQGGELFGSLLPWNEYMVIVSLALRQPGAQRAPVVAPLWLNASNAPQVSFQGIPTLTDSPSAFAPAFWVHQQHFFNPDFATDTTFELFFHNHQLADGLYCAMSLGQLYRYGLTAGVDPTGYFADRIYSHHYVYAPEAVLAWGDVDTLLEFAHDQPPESDPRFRYGLTRVSSTNPSWVPYDAGLVDHLFLMFGLMESIEPLFFKQRLPFQTDDDLDGIADAYDNCPAAWNPKQQDSDGDGLGDACDCGVPWADADGDGDVDVVDFAAWQACPIAGAPLADRCLCFDRNGSHTFDGDDLADFASCVDASGPGVQAPVDCGQ